MTMRKLQLTYREKTGEFIACGPVPDEMPSQAGADWPKESCFAPLGFKPPGKVHFQLGVAVEDGALLLLARGDPDGDGVPEIWALDETSPMIRRIEAQTDTEEPTDGEADGTSEGVP